MPWSAPRPPQQPGSYFGSAAPLTALRLAPANWRESLITRHGWVAIDRHGLALTLEGDMSRSLADAWVALAPDAAAARLRMLGGNLSGWRLVPVTLSRPARGGRWEVTA